MGKGSSSAPEADPRIGEAALKQAETGQQWLSFAKDAFAVSTERQAELDALTKQITTQQLGLATDQANWSRKDRERYETTFKPIEDEFIKEASNYATPERQAEAAAEARGDVQTAAAAARATNERQASAMGINPASGRFAGIKATTDMNTTLAEASAANLARTSVRDKGLALKADVANLGRGLPAQSAAAAGSSVAASGTALSGNQATNAQALAAPSIVSQGYSGAMQGYAGMGGLLSQQYGIQSQNWRAEQELAGQNAAGLGSFLGGVAGMFKFTSDENAKENKEPIADGKALEAVNNMPVEEWDYKPGVEDGGRHVGTYAQDFKKQTGKGDGKSIGIQDAIGISMKAIQDLDKKVTKLGQAIGIGDFGKSAGMAA
ncbi:hypothetical protein J2T08_003599 [Neorhizobium galegae]|uniref:tail fiber domain-containing protein n=1 Tax=Neorhizobium galegae TaxID=399 RepID=UPI0027858DD6|nr:tail fiber domain-containing protein [Neorhizobium galegae]MDQ0135678.1 hypothetical protein [Neorhizobium galegae]